MNKKLTYISLFSGAGVGCYGFKMENFDCVATVELIERRLNVQKFNKKCIYESGYITGDLTKENTKQKVFDEVDFWKGKFKFPTTGFFFSFCTGSCCINMSLHQMSVQPVMDLKGAFQVH